MSPSTSTSSSGDAPMKPSIEKRWLEPNVALSRRSTAWTSIGWSDSTAIGRAITAFSIRPSRTASRAAATAAR
jgi:hypothetical protein